MAPSRVRVDHLDSFVKEHGLPVRYKPERGGRYVLLAYEEGEAEGEEWKEPDLESGVQHKGGGHYRIVGQDETVRGKDAALARLRELFRGRT